MAWTLDDMPDQRGRVAVVTGGNAGLGLEVARGLARGGAHVILAARDQDKAEQARETIAADVEGARLDVREVDLAALDSVRACAEGIAASCERVDVLVNNAGVMAVPERSTANGFEAHLGVNHLGHFALTRRLLPALLRAPRGRVVTVTSFARLFGGSVDPGNPHLRGRYDPWLAYNRSKRANLHFAIELERRLQATGASLQSLAAHPGLSHTDLQARGVRETGGGLSQRFFHTLARFAGVTPERGALPLLRAATDPNAHGGELYGPRWSTFGSPVRRPSLRRTGAETLRTLWEVSERETAEPFDVAEVAKGRA